MNYENQLKELSEKMAREQYPEYDNRFRFRQLEYIESMRPLAVIALAFAAQKVRVTLMAASYSEEIEPYLQSLGLIPTTHA